MPTEMFRPEVPDTPGMWDRIEDRLRAEGSTAETVDHRRTRSWVTSSFIRPVAGALAISALIVAIPLGASDVSPSTVPKVTTTMIAASGVPAPTDMRTRVLSPNADISVRIPEF